jgi:hypothetical protein
MERRGVLDLLRPPRLNPRSDEEAPHPFAELPLGEARHEERDYAPDDPLAELEPLTDEDALATVDKG